jgi:hypothetical protein
MIANPQPDRRPASVHMQTRLLNGVRLRNAAALGEHRKAEARHLVVGKSSGRHLLQSGGLFHLRRYLDGFQIGIEQRLLLVSLFSILFPNPDHFPQDFDIKAIALGFLRDCLD